MCAIFGCGPTVGSREKGGTDTLTAAGMNGYRITSMAVAPPSGYLSRNPQSNIALLHWMLALHNKSL